MKRLTAKQITVTAILLALSMISQLLKNTSVYITGPIINTCIILVVLSAGISCGIILSIITPLTSFIITGSPIMAAIPAIIPCVIAGNVLLAVSVGMFYQKWKGNGGMIAGMAAGTVLKALFMGIVIGLLLIPMLLPASMKPQMKVFQATFSVTQLITAVLGSLYAFILWIPLKRIVKENG